MFSVMPDAAMMNQLMQNPAISQMMQKRHVQYPQYMNQQTLTFQQSRMSQLGQRQSTQAQGQTGAGTGSLPIRRKKELTFCLEKIICSIMGFVLLRHLQEQPAMLVLRCLVGFGAGSLAVPNRSNVPPRRTICYPAVTASRNGFPLTNQENKRALIATAGNVHAAVERLLGSTGQ
ncbi:hypothetical protein NC652_012460 [Populus alba x Populus x berolinensis]|nr:hypothetical protein NC652_012460 [Populus alba x Populus x berolinensis]